MFVCSIKPKRGWVIAVVLLAIVCFPIAADRLSDGNAVRQASSKPTSTVVENNAERIAFLKTFGWTVSEEACEILDIAVPTEFNDVYRDYNDIQKAQGFDLTEYRGKRVKRYTYTVTNYPNHPEHVRANLLVYNNRIIGGDICSLELDGFLHGFGDTSIRK